MNQTQSDIALLYRRAGFGISPSDLEVMTGLGYEAAVDSLLLGLETPDVTGDALAPSPFTSDAGLLGETGLTPLLSDLSALPALPNQPVGNLSEPELQSWWMNRMILTSTPLREKLTLFWHGHFATGISKVGDTKLMYVQNDLFRTSGAGSFETLTQAVAKDGAMIIWLDTGSDLKAEPNENFARELMEIFTVGIGNFTQADVTAAARAFTGWTYSIESYQYVFETGQHDYGSKTFMGHTGDLAGEDVINILVNSPESARFVVAALWSHFAYPVTPQSAEVKEIVPAYTASLNITDALRAMFLHPAFLSPQSRTGLVKQPIEYLVGMARTLNLDTTLPLFKPSNLSEEDTGVTLSSFATEMGQTPFDPPNVAGWGQNGYWLNTATALSRLNAAVQIAQLADLSWVDSEAVAARPAVLASNLGIDGWGPTSAAVLADAASDSTQLVALALVAPEYVMA